MSKLITLLMTAAFAFASAGAFAMSHSGGAADETKMEESGEMKDAAMDACKDMEGEAKDECETMHAEDEAMKGDHSDMKEEKKAE